MSGRTITANKTNIFTFTNNLFSGSGGMVGTYTYAPYTPTMALVKTTLTNAPLAGTVEYLLLNYQSMTKGDCVISSSNLESPGKWISNKGLFEMK